MSARHKLNQGFVQGSLVIAGVIGAACRSWIVFWVATVILVGLSLQSGEVRLTARRRGHRRFPRDRSRSDRHPPNRHP